VSELVKEMTQLLRVSIGASVEIKYALGDQPVVIEGDATQLRQVVMNLVVNASDAIGEAGGTITVTTGRVHADRAYLSGTLVDEGLEEGDYAVIDVSDTGAGMDAPRRLASSIPSTPPRRMGAGLAWPPSWASCEPITARSRCTANRATGRRSSCCCR
jgi:nitrogen fixation/metabolism regulation signal transduction histidine kinase